MALAYEVESLDNLPEDVQKEYVKVEDGKYTLDVQGVVPRAKLDEFRDNNIALKKSAEAEKAELTVRINQLENISERYTKIGEDPDAIEAEISELRKLKDQVDNKKLIDAEGFDTALSEKVDKRVGEMREDYEAKIRALEAQRGELETNLGSELETTKARYRELALEGVLRNEAIKAGALPETVDDIMARANRAGWTLDKDGNPIAMQDGEAVYGASGEKLTPQEWVAGLKKDAGYFFKQNTGGGAGGDSGGTPPPKGNSDLTPAELAKMSHDDFVAYRMKQMGK